MVIILKVKIYRPLRFFNSGSMDLKPSVDIINIIWKYDILDEYVKRLHKSGGELKISLSTKGYRLMRPRSDGDQYVIDLSFKGQKDSTYEVIEAKLKPIVREELLNKLLD